jgi:NADPH-dependent curcumin reductase CurA
MTTSREVRLAQRPEPGADATEDCFQIAEVDLPEPAEGEVRVENRYFSVDPYMRGRMNDARSYVPPFAIGEPLQGHAVGVVTGSRDPQLPEGSLVSSMFGWRESYVAPASALQRLPDPPPGVEPSAYLGVLGMPGFTAWVGVTVIAPVSEGDVVFVSAAAGAVGSIAGQLAKARGASSVIGSAGSDAKVAALREVFGYDGAFSHRDGAPGDHLAELAPKGIDVYFDNVGGAQLRAAIDALKPFGKAALCGSIASGYTGAPGEIVDNLGLIVGKRLTLRGFLVSDHGDRQPEFLAEVSAMLADGRIVSRETVHESIESAPDAFLGLFAGGDQIGKVVVSCGGTGRPAGR